MSAGPVNLFPSGGGGRHHGQGNGAGEAEEDAIAIRLSSYGDLPRFLPRCPHSLPGEGSLPRSALPGSSEPVTGAGPSLEGPRRSPGTSPAQGRLALVSRLPRQGWFSSLFCFCPC